MNTFICLYCKGEFPLKSGNLGKYCSLSHQMAHRGPLLKQKRVEQYEQNPSKCIKCEVNLPYSKKNHKFCSSSCSATFHNSSKGPRSVETCAKIKESMKKYAASKIKKYRRCVVCNKEHLKKKTCSAECLKTLRKQNGIKTAENRTFGGATTKNKFPFLKEDQTLVFLDSSWEQKLAKSLEEHKIEWERPSFFKLSNGKRYTPDFYLPKYNLYLDPKANAREDKYLHSISKIKMFEKEFNVTCLVISNQKDLTWNYIKEKLNIQ
jgi:hypothetical protein